ncbi:MAG: glycoside hydrolase family 20 zincin-like fold domain-containing protein [Tepidisphaerales bacterium]
MRYPLTMCALACFLVGWLGFACAMQAAEPERLRLVPFPKEVQLQSGQFSFKQPLVLEIADDQSEKLGQLLNDELKRAGLPAARVRPLNSPSPAFRLAAAEGNPKFPDLPQGGAPEAYALDVRAGEIVCAAKEPAGVFYAVQTLCQLIRANRQDDAIGCLTVRDWPSLRWRCFQDDMTRGPSSTLDTLKFEASLGAFLKLNLMTFYMEYQYAFKKHPQIGPPNGSLTPEELSALVAYVKPLHLDILGNQQSFGHFGQILKHPEYAQLRETGDVLTPVREETYQLLDDLYSEVCPLLPFPWFNVCCDETWGLGTGPSKELAGRIGVGGVYVQHMQRVHDLLRDKYKKRMMMWGDIILQHPGNLKDIPKDTLMLTWGYDARPSFEDQIVPFAKSGYEFFVCPGVSDWNRILPDFGVATTNIRNFVRDGVKHGAIGMINTDWKDDGEAISAVKWHADAWAAECAWNASTTTPEDFDRRVGPVIFGETGEHFGQAVELLAKTHRLPGMKDMYNGRFWEKDFAPTASPTAVKARAEGLLAVVRPGIEHLQACRREARCNEQVLDAFLLGARRMELIGQRMLDGLAAAQLYEQALAGSDSLKKLEQIEGLIRKNRDAHEAMGKQFAALWLSESKPYALDWTLTRYTNVTKEYDALLGKLAGARAAAAAGKPLPAPEEIGLAIPMPLARRVRPRETVAAPLSPDLPWADATATHRLGVVIRAGESDRSDLPVEVELPLPKELAARPVRAFHLSAQGQQREVLAQLDEVGQPNKSRLILLLPGALARGAEASVHVYLGSTQAPRPLVGAVSTSPGAKGMQWIENDRVRLLLGTEGAHVYRWEVKALGNRDLTMPGESGWAGFSDMAPHRHAPYRLDCTARGPAMVEYQCSDTAGHAKTIRLYGGASWIEVFLSEPTPVYWDIDNPKNFAADGPTPGTWLFSDGKSGPVGREADGVPAQVKAAQTFWGMKHNAGKLALGLITPETAALHVVAPGSGAGGVGIENSPPAQHLVTFAGVLEQPAAETMNRLQATLDLKRPVEVRLHALQAR